MNNDGQNYVTWRDVKNGFKRAVVSVWYGEGRYEARRLYARWRPFLAGCHEAVMIVVVFGCAAMAGWLAASL